MRQIACILLLLIGGVNFGGQQAKGSDDSTSGTATLRIQRMGRTGWLGLSVVAYLNGTQLGTLDTEEFQEFTFEPAENGVNTLSFQGTWWQGDSYSGGHTSFVGTAGSVTRVLVSVTTKGTFDSTPVYLTHIRTEKEGVANASGELPSEIINNPAYQFLVSDSCADPGWFKAGINKAYARKNPQADELMLAKPTLRLLAFSVLLLPVLSIAIFRSGDEEWQHKPWENAFASVFGLGLLVLGVFLAAWIAQLAMNLLWFAGTGSESTFSYSFAVFCVVSLTILAIIVCTVEPLLKAIQGGAPLTRTLGVFGIVLNVAGTIFTLRDLVKLFWFW
ncbi:hypothetical protein [Tautonia rosea]|uniref:hypothetical protein n=1 Tax=Tautonia rosea TaxID=2728037 RepID=UPI0014728219|nr:hypothetical protein [Tautonia rosea]